MILFWAKNVLILWDYMQRPDMKNNTFHFHVEFYPPLRTGDKPKVLAGSESMAGVFIMDVLPEESAEVLRTYMQ